MPPPPPATLYYPNSLHFRFLPPASLALALFLLLLVILYRKMARRRTVPADPKPPLPPQRFSFSLLRRATASFAAANRIGQGGFGPVYKGILPSGQEIAVKLMGDASIQGEREFHNELALASAAACCPHVARVLGFSTAENKRRCRRKRRRDRKLAVVYEYMRNGSLQDALLDRKCVELMQWNKRFSIIKSIAGALEYLHCSCDPQIVHGDVKPSNVLLDSNFDAKISDFGLSRVLNAADGEALGEKEGGGDCGSIIEGDDGSLTEDAVVVNVERSPDKGAGVLETSPSKQEHVGGSSDNGRVTDYVMEWIGSEINKAMPEKVCAKTTFPIDEGDAQDEQKKQINDRKPREWWKEEFYEELAKKKKKRGPKSDNEGELWWQKEGDGMQGKKRRKGISLSSIDSCLHGFSGEIKMGRRDSQDWASNDNSNNNTPKSGEMSSTPSMRGTICYVAPEYRAGARASDKCDVYSFGVLLLVMVSGRRPLQVMGSPMSERANLISWSKQLALSGKMLDLVDKNVESLDHGQAVMCVTIALLCLQRSPDKRPAMREIVGMLSGESEPPGLPLEFSPSLPGNFPLKSPKKVR